MRVRTVGLKELGMSRISLWRVRYRFQNESNNFTHWHGSL